MFTASGHASGLGDITVRLKRSVKGARKTAWPSASISASRPVTSGTSSALARLPFSRSSPGRGRMGRFRAHQPRLPVEWIERPSVGISRPGVAGDLAGRGCLRLRRGRGSASYGDRRRRRRSGRYIIDSPRIRLDEFHALDGHSVMPNIAFDTGSIHRSSAAPVGLKINLAGRLLLNTQPPGSPQLPGAARQDLPLVVSIRVLVSALL